MSDKPAVDVSREAVERLTRELGEARAAEKSANGWYAKLERECQEVRRDLKKAEAERDKARAELATFREKAVIAFQEACTEIKDLRRWANNKGGMFHPEEYVEGIAMIRALKTEA